MDYICIWNDIEFERLKQRYTLKAKNLPYIYEVGINEELPDADTIKNPQVNIWLGNSCTLSNNHLDFFDFWVQNMPVSNFKIICPLSYGDPQLRRRIISVGKELFGEQFVPITSFMPRKEYYALLNTCDIFVMNHNRVQAAGNIFALLMMGKRIYFKETNGTFQFIRKLGGTTFTLSDLISNLKGTIEPLSNIEKDVNIQIAKSVVSKDVNNATLKQLLL